MTRRALLDFSTKEKISMSEHDQVLDIDSDEIRVEQLPHQSDTYSAENTKGNGLAKSVAIGALVGVTLGAIAGALANKGTAERVNRTVKGVGDVVKRAAEGVNNTVKDVGDAAKSVAEGVNYTAKDVGGTVKTTAEGVSDTVKSTVDAVKGTATDVNDTVKGTVDAVKSAAEDVKQSTNQDVKVPEKQRTYILVPVEDEQAVEQTNPVNAGSR